MNSLIDQLRASPHAKLIMDELQAEMKAEEAKRQEFYALAHEDVKAEFINGKVVYQSPVKMEHWNISSNIAMMLMQHVKVNLLGKVAVEKAMVSLSRNDYEPDICFFRSEVAANFSPDQMHFPAPDFVVEILSPSTEAIDRNEKFVDYAAHGVNEYWIVDPNARVIEKYFNKDLQFELIEKVNHGTLSSVAVAGFVVQVEEVFM